MSFPGEQMGPRPDLMGPPAVADPVPRIPQPRSAPRLESTGGAGSVVPRPEPQVATEVLVAVGTDVHRFDRLCDWLERWYAVDGVGRVRTTVQYGRSRAPALPGAVPFLDYAELQAAMARATLVVCHGGPATIMEARRHGHLPIVVPRDPAYGEHVDNHQQLFARRLGAAGLVVLCESETELASALSDGIREPDRFALAADEDRQEARLAAVARVGRIVEQLIEASRRRSSRSWWPW